MALRWPWQRGNRTGPPPTRVEPAGSMPDGEWRLVPPMALTVSRTAPLTVRQADPVVARQVVAAAAPVSVSVEPTGGLSGPPLPTALATVGRRPLRWPYADGRASPSPELVLASVDGSDDLVDHRATLTSVEPEPVAAQRTNTVTPVGSWDVPDPEEEPAFVTPRREVPARTARDLGPPLTVAGPERVSEAHVPDRPWAPVGLLRGVYREQDSELARIYVEMNGEERPITTTVRPPADADLATEPVASTPTVPEPATPPLVVPRVRRASLAESRRRGIGLIPPAPEPNLPADDDQGDAVSELDAADNGPDRTDTAREPADASPAVDTEQLPAPPEHPTKTPRTNESADPAIPGPLPVTPVVVELPVPRNDLGPATTEPTDPSPRPLPSTRPDETGPAEPGADEPGPSLPALTHPPAPQPTPPETTLTKELAPLASAPPDTKPPDSAPPDTTPPKTEPLATTPLATAPPETTLPDTVPPEKVPPETTLLETVPPETVAAETVAVETGGRPVDNADSAAGRGQNTEPHGGDRPGIPEREPTTTAAPSDLPTPTVTVITQRKSTVAGQEPRDVPVLPRGAASPTIGHVQLAPSDDAEEPPPRELSSVDTSVPATLAAPLSQALGTDVTTLPVRRGSAVDAAARQLGARAFTVGGVAHVPDRAGPLDGQEAAPLLAHELTHVVQQQRFGNAPPVPGSELDRQLEDEATAVERWVESGASGPPPPVTHTAQDTPPPDPLDEWEAATHGAARPLAEWHAASAPPDDAPAPDFGGATDGPAGSAPDASPGPLPRPTQYATNNPLPDPLDEWAAATAPPPTTSEPTPTATSGPAPVDTPTFAGPTQYPQTNPAPEPLDEWAATAEPTSSIAREIAHWPTETSEGTSPVPFADFASSTDMPRTTPNPVGPTTMPVVPGTPPPDPLDEWAAATATPTQDTARQPGPASSWTTDRFPDATTTSHADLGSGTPPPDPLDEWAAATATSEDAARPEVGSGLLAAFHGLRSLAPTEPAPPANQPGDVGGPPPTTGDHDGNPDDYGTNSPPPASTTPSVDELMDLIADDPPRRWLDLDDPDDFEEISNRLYHHVIGRLRFDVIVERERSGTLLDNS